MKKLFPYCLIGALALVLYLSPVSAKAEESSPVLPESSTAEETAQTVLTCVKLEENEKWILDEVLSDYVSEDVVELMDSRVPYNIGEWVERDTYTYLFFSQKYPDGIVYTAAGYALTSDGTYVYFELSSPERLTKQLVDLEITKTFGNTGSSVPQSC